MGIIVTKEAIILVNLCTLPFKNHSYVQTMDVLKHILFTNPVVNFCIKVLLTVAGRVMIQHGVNSHRQGEKSQLENISLSSQLKLTVPTVLTVSSLRLLVQPGPLQYPVQCLGSM